MDTYLCLINLEHSRDDWLRTLANSVPEMAGHEFYVYLLFFTHDTKHHVLVRATKVQELDHERGQSAR